MILRKASFFVVFAVFVGACAGLVWAQNTTASTPSEAGDHGSI